MNHHSQSSWRPVLTDDLRSEADLVVTQITDTLRDAKGEGFSLARELPGRALLYAYRDASRGSDEHREYMTAALFAAMDDLSRLPVDEPVPPGLFEGFTGLAWTLQHTLPLYGIDDDPNADFDASLTSLLDVPSWLGSFDLVYGVAGIGIYALERLPHPAAHELVTHCVRLLEGLCGEDRDGVYWFTPPELLPVQKRASSPNGRFDFGVAHGAMGVIGFLAQACARDVGGPSARRLLTKSVEWIMSRRLTQGAAQRYPLFINERGSTTVFGGPYWGWCYGDLGLSAVLCAAARAAHRPDWLTEAEAIATASAEKLRRAPDDVGIAEPGLCHGAAGVAHLFNRLFQATGQTLFRDVSCEWFRYTLNSRVAGGPFGGFLVTALDRDQGRFTKMSMAGFLEGSIGIGLALISAMSDVVPRWDRLLLLDGMP